MILRALLVLLAALNLGAASWWLAHTPPAPARVEPPLPPGVARLVRVEEARPASASAAVAAAAAVPARCYRLGPFDGLRMAEAARTRVQTRIADATPRLAGRARGWRVILPPFASAADAQAAAARVAAAGFGDFFVMREGADANAVALGRFGSESAARRHAEAVRAAGFPAVAEPLGPVWLEVRADARTDPEWLRAASGAARQEPVPCAGGTGGAG